MFGKSVKKEVQPKKEAPKEESIFKIEPQNEMPSLPDFKNKEETDVRYPLIQPYAYAHIHWDPEKKEVMYEIEEPILNSKEKEILKILDDGVKELINISFVSMKEGDVVIQYLEKNVNILLKELGFTIYFRYNFKTITKGKEHNSNQIDINGKKNLEKWMAEIGFSSPKHITKYQIWKKCGYCPPYTTLQERREVLRGERNIQTLENRKGYKKIYK